MEKLIGTEKQIIWAEKIRNKEIPIAEKRIKDIQTEMELFGKELEEELGEELEMIQKRLELLNSESASKIISYFAD